MAYKRILTKKVARSLFLLFYAIIIYAICRSESIPELTTEAPIALYANQLGDDLRKVTKEAIVQAKKSITLVIYSLTDASIIEALNSKAKEGVQVLIVHDRNATPDISFRFHDSVRISAFKGRGLMHYKLLIIDKKAVWFGSTNFTRESFSLHANQILGVFSEEFAKACEKKAEEMFAQHRYKASPLVLKTGNEAMQFFFLPEDTSALEKLLQTIRTATKTCYVAMYTFTHSELQEALIQAKKRGVRVEVVMDAESAKQTSRKAYERFLREKVPVYRSKRVGLLHHKMMICDDTLVTGSANWTKAAFQTNDDCIAFISPLSEAQAEKLDKLWTAIRQESR